MLAQDEARRLDHNYIGTEHILLGLIREGDGVAAQVLVNRGADLNRLRQQVIQQRVGTGPDTRELDEQIETVRTGKEAAVDAQDFALAASLRNREKQLLGSKTAQQEQWTAGHPALPDLAERCHQLTEEIERLHALLRQHGIDPQDKPA